MKKKYFILLLLFTLISCEKSQDNNDILIKLYGDVYEDIGYSITGVSDGYVIAGQLTEVAHDANGVVNPAVAETNKKMVIIKTDFNGNVTWTKSFGDSIAVGSSILALDDGSVICTGFVTTKVNLKDVLVVKVDANGTSLIQKTFSVAGNQYGTDIVKTTDGFIILGSTDVAGTGGTEFASNIAGKKDIYILRLDNSLQLLNTPPHVGYPGNDVGISIKADINGGFIIAGTTDRSDPGKAVVNKVFLLKVNADGNGTAPQIFSATTDEYAADMEVTTDGYIIPVTVGAEGTNQKGYILKVPSDIYSTPSIGPVIAFSTATASYSFKAITRYKSNSFVIAGQSGGGTSAKMLFFSVDAEGNLINGKEKIIGGTGEQIPYDLITDANDNIIAVGKNKYEKNSMITLLKFRF